MSLFDRFQIVGDGRPLTALVILDRGQADLCPLGVPVSVQLDWFVAAPDAKDGTPQVGGAILQLAKGGPLPDAAKKEETRLRRIAARAEVNRLIAVLIHQQLAANFSGNGTPMRERCIVIDPFVPEVYSIYGRLESEVGQIEEAVSEIARQWDSIDPPEDYDG